MVFDFNCWNIKWVSCKIGDPNKDYYWNKLKEAQNDFHDDWQMFQEYYDNPKHNMKINEKFLDENIKEILEKNLYLGYMLQTYILDKYPQHKNTIMNNRIKQKNMNSSVFATGLKELILRCSYKEDEEKLLLFEVAEFALTYPKYEKILIEELLD